MARTRLRVDFRHFRPRTYAAVGGEASGARVHCVVCRVFFYSGDQILDDLVSLSKPPSESVSIYQGMRQPSFE